MQKKQFGRSMIEMLGVLAIIGVLSIGGLLGYRRAVTKYLTNNIIDDVNLSGFLVMDELFSSLPDDDAGLDLTGRFDQKSPYTFKAFAETATSFEILVAGVPYPVCQELMERDLNDYDEVRANGLSNKCLSDGDNEMSFFFDTDQSDRCTQDSDCGHCSHCVKNRCQYGFKNKSGRCFSCDLEDLQITNVAVEECHRCKNRMWSTASNGRCVLHMVHRDNFWNDVSKEECEKFPNQYWTGWNKCLYCAGTYNPTTGICSTTNCERNVGSQTLLGLSEEGCIQCGGTFYYYRPTIGGSFTQCLF